MSRKDVIRGAVDGYFAGLAAKNFDRIPFAENVSFRAPLAPGGVHRPIAGRDAVKDEWWAPMPGLLGAVTLTGVYFDDKLTGAVATGEVEVMTDPPVRLRVADRFAVNDEGLIVEQENHFDPRDVTNPGWQDA
jgi:SnoaL-like domain